MKQKFMTLAIALMAMACGTQANAALVITGILDGPRTGGLPKALELFATADIADLSTYTIDNANNGGAFDGMTIGLTGMVTAGSFLYVGSETPGFEAYFGFAPDFTGTSVNVNGDDVVGLFNNGALVDVFGVLGVDGTGQPWEYLDGWAYRNDNTGPSATFELSQWTFSGVNALDLPAGVDPATATNANSLSPFPIGTFTATAIPEPSTYVALSLIAVGGLVARRRRAAAKA